MHPGAVASPNPMEPLEQQRHCLSSLAASHYHSPQLGATALDRKIGDELVTGTYRGAFWDARMGIFFNRARVV
ncbi:hypothetical protein DHEL01_v209061 [Diaporthe helianthi]|uniref:Uncharacterized protein n=1 Tax=Diaporthe helianthi TaxID=158607 RepID=A0A2P5HQJ8_DIAHE|nr:hypothetical protein DHEL01_v209061 [Diaporthe helianthi]